MAAAQPLLVHSAENHVDQWRAEGRQLAAEKTANQWRVGDWWNAGEAYGERVAIAVELGLDPRTCRNLGWVASRFNVSRRRDGLSFRHHTEVARFDPLDQDGFLDWCLASPDGRPRSVAELRTEINRFYARKAERLAATAVVTKLPASDRCLSVIVHNASARPPVFYSPSEPPALDASLADGIVPPELAGLLEEAPTVPDRLAMGRALFADMAPEERLELITEQAEALGYVLVRKNGSTV